MDQVCLAQNIFSRRGPYQIVDAFRKVTEWIKEGRELGWGRAWGFSEKLLQSFSEVSMSKEHVVGIQYR